MIGNAFTLEWNKISLKASASNCNLHSPAQHAYQAPPVLTYVVNDVDKYECDDTRPLLIEALFDVAYESQVYEEMKCEPNASWIHTDESRNKFGLVSELNNGSVSSLAILHLPVHVMPHNFTINKVNNVTIQRNNKLRRSHRILSSTEPLAPGFGYFLEIEYLRTYLNAGIVSVTLCDYHIVDLDALWRHSYSETEVFRILLKVDPCQHALGNYELQIKHFASNSSLTARTQKQKFKLGKLKLCHARQAEL